MTGRFVVAEPRSKGMREKAETQGSASKGAEPNDKATSKHAASPFQMLV